MLENNQTNSDSHAIPFFARYLEGQSIEDLLTEEMETVKGGYKFPFGGAMTNKWPSDGDDELPAWFLEKIKNPDIYPHP